MYAVPKTADKARWRDQRLKGLKGPELERRKLEIKCEVQDWTAGAVDVRTYTNPRLSTKSAMINVVVGAEGSLESFHIHEDLLCRTSDFFTAALSRDWKESRQKIVRLPEDDAGLFEIFADFLYGGRIHSTKESDTIGNTDDDYYKDPEWERLARCQLILGDKLVAPLFQDASIDAIIQKMVETERAPVNLHGIAYAETSGSNPLKRLVVDIAAWRYTADDFDDSEEDHDSQSQFQRDTIARLRERCDGLRILAWMCPRVSRGMTTAASTTTCTRLCIMMHVTRATTARLSSVAHVEGSA